MQKLALMMAVMMLGMSPVNGCNTSVDSGSQGVGGRAEMMFPPSAWFGNGREALATEKRVNSATLEGDPPVEPGGFSVRRILRQVQQGMEGLAKIKKNSEGREYNSGSGESGQGSRPKREAAQKAMDALKRGADATRGRGRRGGRLYQRTGSNNS